MPSSLSEDSPFRAGVLPETQVLLAGQDLLTGLSSRAGLDAHFRLAVARARRSGARLAVGMAVVDLDPAVPPDEVFGNDLLVVEAAKRLRAQLRETDLIARLGETSFAFVAEEVTEPGAAAIAARVARTLTASADGERARMRARVGVALAINDDSLPALLRAAEERLSADPAPPAALADAANAESFGASTDEEAPVRPRWRTRMRRALGWTSLVVLLAVALSATPGPWHRGASAVGVAIERSWGEVRARAPWLDVLTTRGP